MTPDFPGLAAIDPRLDEEVKAVQIMSSAMKQTPQSHTLLHVQCDFLRSKGKLEWAVKLARQAVNCAPSEFVTWEKLTELYIDLGQYESVRSARYACSALLMFAHRRSSLSIPVPCLHSTVVICNAHHPQQKYIYLSSALSEKSCQRKQRQRTTRSVSISSHPVTSTNPP